MGLAVREKQTNKQTTPKGSCFCSRTSIRNRKIDGSVALAMAELAYVFEDSTFAQILKYKKKPSNCTNLTSAVKKYNNPHPFSNRTILSKYALKSITQFIASMTVVLLLLPEVEL